MDPCRSDRAVTVAREWMSARPPTQRWRRQAASLVRRFAGIVTILGCSSTDEAPVRPLGGTGGNSASGASGVGGGALAGGSSGASNQAGQGGIGGAASGGTAMSPAGSTGVGSMSGGAGAGGQSGAAGAQAGDGGGGAGSSGAAGSAGASGATGGNAGAAGQAGAGSSGAGAAGAPVDDRAAADVLDGFAILKPCVSSFRPSMNPNNAGDCCCEELAANENQRITKQFGGDAGVIYNVTLRIAGVAERYWYSGGTLDAVSQRFYVGGLPTIHGPAPNDNLSPGQGACKIHPPETDGQFALPFTVPVEIRPTDGCYNGFNIFALTVSSPKQSYYLNFTSDFDGNDRQPHSVYETDYTVTLPIAGHAQLDFYTIDGDHHQVTNNGTMTVPDVTTPQPYNGNFLELTVLGVQRSN
jgi:hypothetical protein